jgi:hypothetical protein
MFARGVPTNKKCNVNVAKMALYKKHKKQKKRNERKERENKATQTQHTHVSQCTHAKCADSATGG